MSTRLSLQTWVPTPLLRVRVRLWESLLWLRATEAEDVCHLRLRVTPVSSICVLSCCYGKVIEEEERQDSTDHHDGSHDPTGSRHRILSEFRHSDTGCKVWEGAMMFR